MSKAVFDDIAAGLNDAIAIARNEADPATYRVHVPSEIDVRSIRRRVGLTQERFAATFGFTVQTLRDWEQGRSRPDAASRAYLLVISRAPTTVQKALETTNDDCDMRVACYG